MTRRGLRREAKGIRVYPERPFLGRARLLPSREAAEISTFNGSAGASPSRRRAYRTDSKKGHRRLALRNQRMKLSGAAILVSRGMKVLQAAMAAYPYR